MAACEDHEIKDKGEANWRKHACVTHLRITTLIVQSRKLALLGKSVAGSVSGLPPTAGKIYAILNSSLIKLCGNLTLFSPPL